MLLEGFGLRAAEGGAGGGGTTAGEADLASKRESRFETDVVAGAAGVLAGSRMEACASDARANQKSADSGAAGFTGAGFTEKLRCGGRRRNRRNRDDRRRRRSRWTIQRSFRIEGRRRNRRNRDDRRRRRSRWKYSGASGSKDVDKAEETGATGAAGFCTTEIGTTGFAARVLGVPLPFAPEAATLGATGWGIEASRWPTMN